MKNPTLATLLNIIPGLGYIYVGGKKAIFGGLLLLTVILGFIVGLDPEVMNQAATASTELDGYTIAALVSTLISLIAFMYDGHTSAVEKNKTINE
jgi:hypothetical protein